MPHLLFFLISASVPLSVLLFMYLYQTRACRKSLEGCERKAWFLLAEMMRDTVKHCQQVYQQWLVKLLWWSCYLHSAFLPTCMTPACRALQINPDECSSASPVFGGRVCEIHQSMKHLHNQKQCGLFDVFNFSHYSKYKIPRTVNFFSAW